MLGRPKRDARARSFQLFVFASLVGCLACAGSASLHAEIISVQFQNTDGKAVNFSGVEPDAAAADSQFSSSNQWNHLGEPFDFAINAAVAFFNLINSAGANSGASLSISHISGAFNAGRRPGLPDSYLYSFNTTQNFTISGLGPNENFTLFLYAFNSNETPNARGAVFTVGGASFDTKNGTPSSQDPDSAVTGLLTGETSSTGSITGTWAFDSENSVGEIDWSAFQLAVGASSAAAVPEPGTFALLAGGLALLGVVRRRRSQ